MGTHLQCRLLLQHPNKPPRVARTRETAGESDAATARSFHRGDACSINTGKVGTESISLA